jgi:hypothetical protein
MLPPGITYTLAQSRIFSQLREYVSKGRLVALPEQQPGSFVFNHFGGSADD